MTATHFTKREAEFLAHRLALPDALSDALSDVLSEHESDEIAIAAQDQDAVSAECTRLTAWVETRSVRSIVDALTPLQSAILTDAVEGNTWVVNIPDDMTEEAAKRAGAIKTARSAAEKLRAAGLDVQNAPEF